MADNMTWIFHESNESTRCQGAHGLSRRKNSVSNKYLAFASKMKPTREELMENHVPLHARDNCAHLVILLNKCRHENLYMPWHCGHERHEYELCLYKEYERRKAMKKEQNHA